MSPRMYGTLRLFIQRPQHLDNIKIFDQRTTLALLLRGYLKLHGRIIVATTSGWAAYNSYHSAKAATRKPETQRKGITDSVSRAIKYSERKSKRA